MSARNKLAEYYDAELANVTGLLFDALNEIKRLKEERRTLWMILKSNGGYTLEYTDTQNYPGDDRAIITRTDDPINKTITLGVSVGGQ